MTSLRLRLFLLVAAATALVWSLAATWTALAAQADIERVLDKRLREAASMVASLGYETRSPSAVNEPAVISVPSSERQLSCQIWSVTGDLVGLSGGAPKRPLSSGRPGFSEQTIDGIEWRVYTHVAPESGLSVMVGDTLAMRRELVADLVIGLVVPAIVGLVALGILLWIGVGRGLAPVDRIAAAVAARRPDDRRPLEVSAVPRELAPLTAEINQLFARIEHVRESERRFLASAAHEMQTPLAGLRTHAEIALKSDDYDTRRRALERIRLSVDRTSRLVRQLLELSRQQFPANVSARGEASLVDAIDIVAQDLVELLERRRISLRIEAGNESPLIPMTEDALVVAVRNLVENAALHGPEGGTVTIRHREGGFSVIDEGVGIVPDKVAELLQPFVRHAGPDTPGSGLGLAIAAAALKPAGLVLLFESRANGFEVIVATKAEIAEN